MKPGNLLWLDLEMTGLNPAKDKILEAAAIITNWQLQEFASFETAVFQPPGVLEAMEEWSKINHGASGLTAKIAEGKPADQVEQELLKLLDDYCEGDVYLAGNSIHQDRRFIRAYWPTLDGRLHYRMLDVSAWKIVMLNRFKVDFKKADKHRALEDIRGSIQELKVYLNHVKA